MTAPNEIWKDENDAICPICETYSVYNIKIYDTDIRYIQADKANELIRELTEALEKIYSKIGSDGWAKLNIADIEQILAKHKETKG